MVSRNRVAWLLEVLHPGAHQASERERYRLRVLLSRIESGGFWGAGYGRSAAVTDVWRLLFLSRIKGLSRA